MPITIRPLHTVEDAVLFQKVERMVWGSDDESLVPTHIIVTLGHNGGLVLGAFDEEGPAEVKGMVGMTLGWYGNAIPRGESQPRVKLCSHMAGVLPAWQRKRVGLQLKLAQRDWALREGVTEWVTWTFDPLYRANGVFNMHRLGAVCTTYIEDLYGEMTDALNSGGPSDRCQVDWWLNSARVQRAVALAAGNGRESTPADYPGLEPHLTRAGDPFQRPSERKLVLDGRPVGVPVPDDIGAIRRHDMPLAIEWRYALRTHLQSAFDGGYHLVDCLQVGADQWNYVLTPVS